MTLDETDDVIVGEYEGEHFSNLRFYLAEPKRHSATLCVEIDSGVTTKTIGWVSIVREYQSGEILAYQYDIYYFGSVSNLLKFVAANYKIGFEEQ